MLKKCNRLKSKKAFSATYNNHNITADNLIVLYAGKLKPEPNNENGLQEYKCWPVRVGFVVSKKVHKRAVIRNRIKRLMRENIRQIIKEQGELFDVLNRYQSLIFIAKNEIPDKNFQEVRCSILTLLNKLANKNL